MRWFAVLVCAVCVAANAHTLRGVVTDMESKPVAGAGVWLSQDRVPRKTETAEDGSFSFDDVLTGPVELVAWKEGFACGGLTARVAGDAEVGVQLRKPGSITLHVIERRLDPRTAAGTPPKPVVGARVETLVLDQECHISVADLAPLGFPGPRSDENGYLMLSMLPEGGFVSFAVKHRQFAPQHVPMYPVGGKELTLQMVPGVILRGRVTDENKRGVGGARVSILKSGAPPLKEYEEALTDADGFYQAVVEPGAYFVVARHRQFATTTPTRVAVSADVDETACDVGLVTAYRIAGRVTDTKGAAVPGVTVQYVADETVYDETLSDARGDFALTARAGAGKVHVIAPDGYIAGLGTDIDVAITDADVAIAEPITITELPVVSGRVVDGSGAGQPEVLVASRNLEPAEWTMTDAEGRFSLRLSKAPPHGTAEFRAEHTRRFLRKDFVVTFAALKEETVTLEEFEPNLAACDQSRVRNQLAGFRDKPAPAIDCRQWFNTGDAATPTLESLRGKVVVLVFWGGFDTTEQGLLRLRMANTLHDAYSDAGDVVVLGIHDSASDPEEVRQYIRDYGVKYPTGIDNETATFDLYDIHSIPQIVLIDKKGVFRYYDVDGRLLELIKALRREAG